MVVRRKYRKPLAFKDGGAVPVIDQVTPSGMPATNAAVPEVVAPEQHDAIAGALKAQLHAEELARNAARERDEASRRAADRERERREELVPARAQPLSIEEQIDRIPDISEFKRQTLKQFPRLMDPSIAPLAHRHYAAALADGVEDDTELMQTRILEGVTADLRLMERARAAPLRTDPAVSAPAARAQEPPPERQAQPPIQQRPAALPLSTAPARRSIPVSAPVSREVPSASGRPLVVDGQIKLTAEERAIARNSFGAVGGVQMSDAEKERLYARNKARYLKMREDGTYSDQGGGR